MEDNIDAAAVLQHPHAGCELEIRRLTAALAEQTKLLNITKGMLDSAEYQVGRINEEYQRAEQLNAAFAAAERRVGELSAALFPFASASKLMILNVGSDEATHGLTVDNFRNAARALSARDTFTGTVSDMADELNRRDQALSAKGTE